MKINGNKLAEEILQKLKVEVSSLKEKGITPKLAIILIGNNPISQAYVSQKEQKAKEIGAETTTIKLSETTTDEELKKLVNELNSDLYIHGIIIQRPLPYHLNPLTAIEIIDKEKDVDGFGEDSGFESPLSQACFEALRQTTQKDLLDFLKDKQIVVIGKGETGGRPIIKSLKERGIEAKVIDTQTENPKEIIKNSDIVISTVGKPNVFNGSDLKQGAIVIAVGMFKDENGEFQADFNQEEIEKVSSFYTHVPGGIGPLTVTFLLKNLLKSASN